MIIAQISDLHIKAERRPAYRKVDTATALERCVAHLNGLKPQPTLVAITGDLADRGEDAEYGLLRELLAPLSMPFYLLPGNHDDRAALRRAFADHAYLHADEPWIQYAINDFPVRLLALDTVTPGSALGSLCPRRLAWLSDRLAEDRERPTVLALHHPPFLTGIAHMDAMRLIEGADALGDLVAAHPQVERLLCGHVHRPVQVRWRGTVASIAPSPAHQVTLDLDPLGPSSFVLEPPAYQLHVWLPETGLVTHQGYVGAFDGPYPFFAEGALID
jgi:3',5'-cyclic AMP phosphodiesterase CpdA